MTSDHVPPLAGVLETVLYYEAGREDELRRFYGELLGLATVGGGLGFRAGPGVVLLFDAARSAVQASPPPHGATGRVHACFLAPPGGYAAWRERIEGAGVEVIEELTWSRGLRSFYFHDPAGNVLEIAEGDIWV